MAVPSSTHVLPNTLPSPPHQCYAVRLDPVGPEELLHYGAVLCQDLKQLHLGEGAGQVIHMHQLAGGVARRGQHAILGCKKKV